MSKFTKSIVAIIMGTIIYLFMAFISLEIDFRRWSIDFRSIFVISLVLIFILVASSSSEKIKRK